MHVSLTANLDIDPWTDLLPGPIPEAALRRVGVLPNGTSEQRAVVALLVEYEGKPVMVQVTWRMWQTLNAALAATPVMQMEDPS